MDIVHVGRQNETMVNGHKINNSTMNYICYSLMKNWSKEHT